MVLQMVLRIMYTVLDVLAALRQREEPLHSSLLRTLRVQIS